MDATERQDEARLKRAVLRGDRHAWRILYDRNFDVLAAWVRSRRGPESAEDVLQETWLTAVRRMRDFEPERGTFLAWLCGIAKRVGAADSRNASRQPPGLEHEPVAKEVPEPTPLEPAFALLPESYRELLLAKYGDRRSVADIARETGATPKAVESMLTRARSAFRDAWKKTEDLP